MAEARSELVALLVAQFFAAIADRNLSGEEIAGLLETLSKLVDAASLFDRLGALISDAVTRDADELRNAAKRKRNRAEELRNAGRPKRRSDDLIDEAKALEAKAKERDKDEQELVGRLQAAVAVPAPVGDTKKRKGATA